MRVTTTARQSVERTRVSPPTAAALMATALKIGSRPSQLALAQAAIVRERLIAVMPGLQTEIVEIRTSGDRMTSASLASVGGKGLFIKELEQALAEHRVDLAVHSMKDLPAELAPEYRIAAVPERADARDAIVSRDGLALEKLPPGARVGTSSIRRQFQALKVNPHIAISPLRGNVDTRLKRVTDGELDAVIIAIAGIRRLWRGADVKRGADIKVVELDERDFIPAVGQGALAVETLAGAAPGRSGDLERALAAIDDPIAHCETAAERAFLATIGASCLTPVGVRATQVDNLLTIRAILFSADGLRELNESVEEPLAAPLDTELARAAASRAGERLGQRMLARGARALIGDE
jgi:hydroxymethylbilane synthase